MKILVVTQYFWPENFRINDLCSELASRGHKITVLTGKPNYPDGKVFSEFKSNPKLYQDYKGCKVIRVPLIPRGNGTSFKLFINYFSYSFFAIFFGLWKLKNLSFDSIFIFQPSPVTVGLPGIIFKKIKKAPIIFWVLDLWPKSLEAVGAIRSKLVLRLVGRLVSLIYNHCDLILGQSRAFYSDLKLYANDSKKIKYFPNWAESIFSETLLTGATEINQFSDTFKILFAGNIGEAQDFPSILKALKIIQKQNEKIKLFVVGDGRKFKWLQSKIIELELENYVFLLGPHNLEKMPSFYSDSDALLVSLKDSDIFAKTIPGKLQSYMAVGKPILTMLSGEGSRVIQDADCGYIANSGDFKLLAENIIRMSKLTENQLSLFGSRARLYSNEEFNRAKLISQLELWFLELSKTYNK